MEMVKKYWWIGAIILVIFFLWYVSKKQDGASKKNCRDISWDDWYRRKENLKNTLGSWELAHKAMLEEGYCEHIG